MVWGWGVKGQGLHARGTQPSGGSILLFSVYYCGVRFRVWGLGFRVQGVDMMSQGFRMYVGFAYQRNSVERRVQAFGFQGFKV
jgi:hypothetical protein